MCVFGPYILDEATVYHVITRFRIDHFRDLPTDSQTTDITHFAVVFNYDVTIEALEIIRSTAKCL